MLKPPSWIPYFYTFYNKNLNFSYLKLTWLLNLVVLCNAPYFSVIPFVKSPLSVNPAMSVHDKLYLQGNFCPLK
jgi:hypothetical protein